MPISCDQLFQNSPNAYMVLDREFRYLEVNRAYEQVVGRSRAELIGTCLFDQFPGIANADGSSQAGPLRASIERAFVTGERDVLALIPYVIADEGRGDGEPEVRYWSATHTPMRDEHGEVVAVMQHTTDVTAMQRLREEIARIRTAQGPTLEQVSEDVLSRAAAVQRDNARLVARQGFLTGLFEQAPGFMAVLRGPDHIFDLTNPAYERLVGRRDLLGRTVRQTLPEMERQGFFELLDQVRTTGRPFVGRSVPVDIATDGGGSRTAYVDFVYQPIRDVAGGVDSIFVLGSDVTDREHALAALRDSEQRFRTIANLLPQLIWSTRPDGYHDYYNDRWYDFTGVPEGSTDGEGWVGMFHPDDRARARALWRHSLETGEPYEIEYRLRDRDGEYRWVLGRALPVRDAEGAIVRWMGTCTVIDEQKRVQALLEQSREALRSADRQKNQFLAMLAHELRNPLSPITTAAHLLKMGPDRIDNVKHAASIIERQARHMSHLVEDLMDASRVTRGQATLQPVPLRLADVIDAAVEQTSPLLSQRRHHLGIDNHVPDLRLHADPVRITQILTNVLNNAAKYTPDGGRIRVVVDQRDELALVSVHDNGIGMEPALLERVFGLFTQADTRPDRAEGGLGIGLALARSLARLHGGDLVAFSDGPGRGSTFELRLPLAPAGAGKSRCDASLTDSSLSGTPG